MTLLHGDSLEKLKELAENSIDCIVTDPPYFLTNGSGSGFMGKQWDSLSIVNAFAESVLRSLSPVWLMVAANPADAPANTSTRSTKAGKTIHALYVERNAIDRQPKLSLGEFSVRESVITRAEALALSRALCPSLTDAIESQSANVLYVVRDSFTATCPKRTAQELALKLHTAELCEDLTTLHSLMGDPKTKSAIAGMIGSASGLAFTDATIFNVENVERSVAEERYSATTSCPIDYRATIRWITSLRFVRSATATFTAIPGNIQLLSERFHHAWLSEALRVLKPGGHILTFAGTRTYHRLVRAAEDCGFEVRDMISWIYGSGFPKSLDVSKAIDKAAGAEREVVGFRDPKGSVHGAAAPDSTGCAAVSLGFSFIGIEREQEYVEIAKRRISHHANENHSQLQEEQLCMPVLDGR